jgi:hypothetical protein
MNKLFKEEIDLMVSDMDKIPQEQYKPLGIDYLKVRRIDNKLIILSMFSSVFLMNMHEHFRLLDRIKFPNKTFKCLVFLAIDLDRSRLITHRLYSFPILDGYAVNGGTRYKRMYEQLKDIKEANYEVKIDLPFILKSRRFNTTEPIDPTRSLYYNTKSSIDISFFMDIDRFIEKYVSISGYNVSLNDPYYSTHQITKEEIIDSIECRCLEDPIKLSYACLKNGVEHRRSCNGHHSKKCQCGKFTYYRRNTCMKCHIIYSKGKSIDEVFTHYEYKPSTSHGLLTYIPYLHYNQGSSGLCLGGGYGVIGEMLSKNINPIRLILSFKANLAFTDVGETTAYYKKYRGKISNYDFKDCEEHLVYLNRVFRDRKTIRKHVFSIYCYCPQCLIVKIILFSKDKKLNINGFEISDSYFVSRDEFIKLYTRYLKRLKNDTYINGYIHKMN